MRDIVVQRFRFFTIRTRDLDKARQFHVELLRFPILDERNGEFFQVSIAGVPVCVDLDADFAGQASQIGIAVADLDGTRGALRERGLAISEGRSAKETWVAVKDPDGHEVVFIGSRS